jgi:alginate O-acetyltransferase complex protein AlgJ
MQTPRILFICLSLAASSHAADFTAAVTTSLSAAPKGQSAVPGAVPPWRFVIKELSHLSKGDLAQAADLTQLNVEGTDPLPIIQEYASALKVLGVDLLLVPVPTKASIYPDKLALDLTPADATSQKAFLDKIASTGIQVTDLETLFRQHRIDHPEESLFCATDSHWSPLGAELAAKAVATHLASLPSISTAQKTPFTTSIPETLQFHGDLLTDPEKASTPPELLPIRKVSPATSGPSPVLVIGDSHCQVFRTGGPMLATDAGFIDHLAAALSLPIEDISSQASGADQPRADIARRTVKEPDFWSSRKVVVWLFTAREFTQGKWRTIPTQVKKK